MTVPGFPPSPTIEALRAALAGESSGDLRDAAEVVVREYDDQIAAVQYAMSIPRPSADEVRAQLLRQPPPRADCTCPDDAWHVECPAHTSPPPSLREIVAGIEARREGVADRPAP